MRIERLRAWNFKNFEEASLELRHFNILVGANASGKSNTLELLKFIRDVATVGLDNAISLQGGAKYFTNLRAGLSRDFRLEILTTPGEDERVAYFSPPPFAVATGGSLHALRSWRADLRNVRYTLGIHFGSEADFELVEDTIDITADFSQVELLSGEPTSHQGEGTIGFRNTQRKVEVELSLPKGVWLTPAQFAQPFSGERRLPPQKTISLETPLYLLLGTNAITETEFREIEVFDIDPKSPKFGVGIAAKADLEDDGQNLALVLKSILEDEKAKRKLSNLLRDLLPFVGDLAVEPFADRTFLFKLQETFFPQEYLPASLLSDGTINIAALIVALYFSRQSIVAFEEPERNLHPSLIAKLMHLLRDASQHKQVIITTHSPEVVRYADLDELILVSRDKAGVSTLSRPADKDRVRAFLENEIGIDELYVKNMLER